MADYYFVFGAIGILLTLNLAWDVVRSKSTRQELLNLRAEIEGLKHQSLQLRQELQAQRDFVTSEFQFITFQCLQALLVNYPTVKEMVKFAPDIPAQNLLALFEPLDILLEFWRYQSIGIPWIQVNYNPRFHQGDSADLQIGEPVYIRFVGYSCGDRILVPAQVSRTLPFNPEDNPDLNPQLNQLSALNPDL